MATNPSDKTRSKFLSLVLRHQPETIGLPLDGEGWADVSLLLEKLAAHGMPLSIEDLQSLVANNDKKRFVFSEDGARIRASQGHSIDVDLRLTPLAPPERLFHGTAERNLASIREKGLLKGERHHVHLSDLRDTALAVGSRYGKPVVLTVRAAEMHRAGHSFYRSENGVWLTDGVPPEFIGELPAPGAA